MNPLDSANLSTSSRDACGQLETYLDAQAPDPNLLETDTTVLRAALRDLGGRSLLGLKVPRRWGGTQVADTDYFAYQEALARYSGTLAFIQTQHQTAGALIARGSNEFLKQKYLPYLSQGQILVGVGFSHLRRAGEPLLRAVPQDSDYRLSGTVPWLSGYGLFQRALIAATLPDRRVLLALLPFGETTQSLGGMLTFSQPMQLAAMNATNTVSAKLHDWRLSAENIVDICPADWLAARDRQSILSPTALALGSARAGLDVVQVVARAGIDPAIHQSWAGLARELSDCRAALLAAKAEPAPADQQLQLRAWALELAQRCAYAAAIVSRGAANQRHSAAQRIYREVMVFAVSGQTAAVMAAMLTRLVR